MIFIEPGINVFGNVLFPEITGHLLRIDHTEIQIEEFLQFCKIDETEEVSDHSEELYGPKKGDVRPTDQTVPVEGET